MFDEFVAQIDEKWHEAYIKLMETIDENLPPGFEKSIDRNMIVYNVPLTTYPKGYHVTPGTPLPFLALAPQKRHIGLYHMGVYSDPELLTWFQESYADAVPTKLNMGKSCIRFTSTKHIPYGLIGELSKKITVEQWITTYENALYK
ncbi:DUF1801 domain-containing protein [Solibacillus sp. FSL W7-1464]|uniref:DUF1801 domain-containing protein n=1 Tax=Solibacillus sp. FSL W7-1464 TaxID=2921706 RepID=UPI0030FAC075